MYTDCLASQCTGLDDNSANGTCTAWPTFGTACDDNAGNTCIDDQLCTNVKCVYSYDQFVCN